MFQVEFLPNNQVKLWGRFTATDVPEAEKTLEQLTETTVVDMSKMDYISSAGLSVLLKVQKKLKESGKEIKLINMSSMIRELFRYVGFDKLFTIE